MEQAARPAATGPATRWQAEVHVTYKRGVLDPQGEAIRSSLVALGFESVGEVKTGKYLQLELDAPGRDEAAARVEDMCRRLLANPVIEDYRLAVSPVPVAPGGEGGRR